MPRINQGPGVKGNQKGIQKLVVEKPDLLNSLIRTQLNLPDTDTITWLSLLVENDFAEYQDQAFIDELFISSAITLKSFFAEQTCQNIEPARILLYPSYLSPR
jgi:hypothetical protein